MDDPLAIGPRPHDPRHGNGGNGVGLPASRCDQTALDIEEIKRGTSILDVLDHHQIAVEGSGLSRRARCPFHDDRVPSFRAYLNTNRYYCFGCGAKGDVIELVQRLEGVSFREALERLATISPSPPSAAADSIAVQSTGPAGHHAAVESTEQDQTLRWEHAPQRLPAGATVSGPNVDTASRDEGLAAVLLAAASALYQASLLRTPHALAYLLARGIPRATAIEARLGFADGTCLRRFIGHDPALARCATQMGLLDGWGRERLRERLVMPVFRGGRCIWMIGRQVGDAVEQDVAPGDGPPVLPVAPASASGDRAEAAHEPARRARSPRYLGLTLPKPLFDLDLVPDDTRQTGALRGVLVVEGIFDVLTVRTWRLPIACVALIGTHLRRDQLQDLLTLAHGGPIWLGLDADESGEKAAERLKDQLVTAGCPADTIRRLRPPGGAKDLSEVVHEAHARTAVLASLAADSSPDGVVLGHQASAASGAGGTRQSMRSPHVRQLAHPDGGHDDATLG